MDSEDPVWIFISSADAADSCFTRDRSGAGLPPLPDGEAWTFQGLAAHYTHLSMIYDTDIETLARVVDKLGVVRLRGRNRIR